MQCMLKFNMLNYNNYESNSRGSLSLRSESQDIGLASSLFNLLESKTRSNCFEFGSLIVPYTSDEGDSIVGECGFGLLQYNETVLVSDAYHLNFLQCHHACTAQMAQDKTTEKEMETTAAIS